mgnify:CR=1 FL=1
MINYNCIVLTDSMTMEEIFSAFETPAPVVLDLRVESIEYTVPDLVRLYNDWKQKRNSLASISTTGSRPKSIEI